MLMKCPVCGDVEVLDEAYKLQEKARKFHPMIGGGWLRCHPLTCVCGRELEEI